MKKIILFNILAFFLLMALFIAGGFAMGYAANKKYGSDAALLFVLMVVVHLFFNFLLLHRLKKATAGAIIISCLLITGAYLLLIFH